MVLALCFSKITFAIKECSIRAQEMVWVTLLIYRVTNTKVSTGKVSERDKVYSRQMMDDFMREAGTITRCMDVEEKPFQMENALSFTIKMATNLKHSQARRFHTKYLVLIQSNHPNLLILILYIKPA
jgi:hypothetical protein